MEFVQKAASVVVQRALLELEAMPKGTGNADTAMAVVGLSNVVIKGIELSGSELELESASVPEGVDAKDPLEGMSESRVDFDNPVPVPSLVTAVGKLLDEEQAARHPCSMRVRNIDGLKVVSLTNAAFYTDSALPEGKCIYTKRTPKALNRIGDYAIPESMLGLLLGQQRRFFAEKRKAGFPCRVAYSSGRRRYIRIHDGVAFMKMYGIAFGMNGEVMDSLLQAISNE